MPRSNQRESTTSKAGQPYHYDESGLDLGIEGFGLNGDRDSLGSPDYDERIVDVTGYGSWEEVTIVGDVNVDESTLKTLVPEDEYDEPPLKVIVKIDTLDTQRRLPNVVKRGPLDEIENGKIRSFDFEHTFARENVHGEVLLEPRLVRTDDCDEGLPYAPSAGMQVAAGKPWVVKVDSMDTEGEGFPSMYQDFSDDDHELNKELVHALQGSRQDPKVVVNSHHDEIVDVLESGRGGGFRPRMRKIVGAEISTMTYVQLVLHTAGTVAENGECEHDWQKGLLVELDDYLYPDLDVEETETKLSDAVQPENLREFSDHLNQAIQLYTKQSSHLNGHIRLDGP
ncbi:hypothetical protein JCM30237_12880 [Halolamina litorea]|uniref:Uncharacterized protein n=1 Tax=Halolamina litorea TaxID=1515593 RepID=A0ABD6BM40_9EURY|nr:hypothetical protein [Halolamina litorea]